MLSALQTSNQYQLGVVAILFASLLWGTTGTAASFAPNVSPLAIGAFAMGVGGLIQAALFWRHIHKNFRKMMMLKPVLATGSVALAIYPLAFYSSMKLSGVAVGTVISIASAPFFTVIIELLLGKNKHISAQWCVSFIIGVIGIIMLVMAKTSGAVESEPFFYLIGILLGLVAGLTYATYSWVAKRMINHGIPSQAALGTIFAVGALLLLPSLAFTGANLFSGITNSSVALYMALVPMCLGYLAYGYGLRYVDVSSANLLTLFEPVVAAVFAVWIVGEKIEPSGWIGVGLIGVCLILQTVDGDKFLRKSKI